MDYFRKFFSGTSQHAHESPDDFYDQLFQNRRRYNEDKEHQQFGYEGFQSPFHSPGDMMDEMSQMMDMMDRMMKGFHGIESGPGFFNFSFDGRDSIMPGQHLDQAQDSSPANPRDNALKQPDSESGVNTNEYNDSALEARNPEQMPGRKKLFNSSPHTFFDPFSLFSQFFSEFSHSDAHNWMESPNNNNDSQSDTPRETLLREDVDLDQEIKSNDLKDLLKTGPKYTFEPPQSAPLEKSIVTPKEPSPRKEPFYHQYFKSSSVQRVTRPDGTIEEKRTYKDSSGREEVTVTEIDPKNAPHTPNNGGGFGPMDDAFRFFIR